MPIKLEQVDFVYAGGSPFERAALKGINLSFLDGEFVGIIGQTGSGKSTLVQMLNGLLKPTRGTVTVNGLVTTAKGVKLKSLRQEVGLVFQFAEYQLFAETVAADVAFGPENQGVPASEIAERVDQALLNVGLPLEIKERSPFELSGGQMRRVAIAGVLAMNPKVLILDEPTAGLDPRGRDEILSRIRELHRQRGITVILVSHSMEDVARLVDRLVVIHGGQIVYDATPREVFAHGSSLKTYGLGVPQATEVLGLLKAKGWAVPEVALTLDEARQAIVRAYQLRRELA
ncbi:MAG: Energy-coupling factor transporter ATP-binding protein EcfA2 [Firmicutes bacterium]|nr:Energy-coupling factor transporter ATP-binding protein EcfA2 [Bacillota bacterium]MBT9151935.1 Energy-coupling factor transporter ATP-binding protein EcfA2 [Bacillota bacterium]MBT9157506.1 Energy-coupling factor transporter ATP-binding protein EcfA2 [Bacillota bacterium]